MLKFNLQLFAEGDPDPEPEVIPEWGKKLIAQLEEVSKTPTPSASGVQNIPALEPPAEPDPKPAAEPDPAPKVEVKSKSFLQWVMGD